nr:ABC transporter permease [Deinobacterium chartae]
MLAEVRKARFKKRFWLILGLLGLIVPLIQLLIGYIAYTRVGDSAFDQQNLVDTVVSQLGTAYGLARNNLGGTLQLLLLPIAAITGSFLIGEERGYRMWKVILTAQPRRFQVLAGKFGAGMLILGALLLLSGLSNALLGLIAQFTLFGGVEMGLEARWGELIALYALQWVVCAAPLLLSFLLSSLIASPAMSLIATVLLPGLLEQVVRLSVLTQLERVNALNAAFQFLRIQSLSQEVPRYFLTPNLNLGSAFAGQGLGQFLDETPAQSFFDFSWSSVTWSVEVALVYAAVFGLLFWLVWFRRDVLD